MIPRDRVMGVLLAALLAALASSGCAAPQKRVVPMKPNLPQRKAVLPEKRASAAGAKPVLPEKKTAPVEREVVLPGGKEGPSLKGVKAEVMADVEIYRVKPSAAGAGSVGDGSVRLMNDNPAAALNFFKDIGPLEASRWEPYYNSGLMYMKLNDMENAREGFYAALRHGAPAPKVYSALGTLYSLAGKHSNAVEFLNGALMLEKSPYTMVNLANAYAAVGRAEEAARLYRDAEEIEPSNPLVHYNMALVLYGERNYEGALERFEKAALYRKKDPRTLFARAQTLVKLGRYEDALRAFEETKGAVPQDARPYRNIGIIYEVYLGDMEKALENYAAYLEKDARENKDVRAWVDVIKAKLAAKEKKDEG